MRLLIIIPKSMAIITEDTGDFSNPKICFPRKPLNQILNHARSPVKITPGSRVGIFVKETPKKFFSIQVREDFVVFMKDSSL